ncbi:MAG: RNA polymerase sigma factor [Thermoanaerobaculia bacterium]
MNESVRKPEERDAFSDEEVVRRVRAGQIDLFEILMRRYNQRVYRLARAVLRTDSEAEDVTQEAWVRAYAHLDQFEGRAGFSTWLGRIAIHEAWARMRRSRRFETREPDPSGEDREMKNASVDPNPEGAAFGREVRLLVEAAVEALPEGYRTVFVLRQIEELSTAETAECLELSEETVRTRLHRARSALRQQLLEKAGPGIRQAFPFLGRRCDRMVESVLARVRRIESEVPAS